MLNLANYCKEASVLEWTLRVCVHSDVTANSVHPGVVLSEVMRYYPAKVRILFNLIGMFFFKVSTDHLRCRFKEPAHLVCNHSR